MDFTQEFTGAKRGISVATYSKLETGITDFNLSRLEQIAALFEMTLVQIFTYHERSEMPSPHSPEYFETMKKIESYEAEILDFHRKLIELTKNYGIETMGM